MDILRRLVSSYAKPAKTRRRRPNFQFRCGLEPLEERLPMAAYVVNSLADGAPVADGLLTLREAITAASTNAPSGDAPAGDPIFDTIRFDFSTHYGTIALDLAQGNLAITGGGELSIIGPDATSPSGIVISGRDAVRVFNISSSASRVMIENLTVTRGDAGVGGIGGGIVNLGPDTTLRNVAVTNSRASFGGGVSNLGTTKGGLAGLTILDSLISGNEGRSAGGGVHNRDGNVTVIRCEISGNFSFAGGGLQNEHSLLVGGVTMTILDSLISGNQAVTAGGFDGSGGSGGGVSSASPDLTLKIQGCTIVGNRATAFSAGTDYGAGGGVYAAGTCTIVNSTITGNLSGSQGAGITFLGGTLTIVNATIVGNAVTYTGVGGIRTLPESMVHMYDSIVSLNTAPPGSEENVLETDLATNLNNFIDGDPKLGPLQDNGGRTPTMLPLPGSPVIDAGSNEIRFRGVKTDQRGFARFVDGDATALSPIPGDASRIVDIGAAELSPLPAPLVVGADAGGAPHVKVYLPDGSLRFSFFAYAPGFTGGVRVATGDVSGDGVADIITVPGPGGGPHVKVFSGVNGALIRSFFAYDAGFTGGVYVAAGDVDGDGRADIITGAGAGGGPHVRVFSGNGGAELASFFAYDAGFRGGVRVAAGDLLNYDGKGRVIPSFRADIITAPGPGGGPHVKVFSGANVGIVLRSFFAFDVAFTGGVYVAAGDTNGDGKIDIIAGAGEGASPRVRVFHFADPSIVLLDFLAYAQGFTGGVRVGAVDRNGDGRADILTAAGPTGGPHVRTFDGLTADQLDSFFAFEASFAGGMFIS